MTFYLLKERQYVHEFIAMPSRIWCIIERTHLLARLDHSSTTSLFLIEICGRAVDGLDLT